MTYASFLLRLWREGQPEQEQEGTVADEAFPVALSGRVFCWADASYDAIQPGYLLTTSATVFPSTSFSRTVEQLTNCPISCTMGQQKVELASPSQ